MQPRLGDQVAQHRWRRSCRDDLLDHGADWQVDAGKGADAAGMGAGGIENLARTDRTTLGVGNPGVAVMGQRSNLQPGHDTDTGRADETKQRHGAAQRVDLALVGVEGGTRVGSRQGWGEAREFVGADDGGLDPPAALESGLAGKPGEILGVGGEDEAAFSADAEPLPCPAFQFTP